MNQELAKSDESSAAELAGQIRDRCDFVAFLRVLLKEMKEKPAQWDNADLPSYLEAMANWVEDMCGYYHGKGETMPPQPSWKMLAEIALAARVYE